MVGAVMGTLHLIGHLANVGPSQSEIRGHGEAHLRIGPDLTSLPE